MNERKWIDIEPSEPSLAAYEVSKKVISQSSSIRSNSTTRRRRSSFDSGESRNYLQNQFPHGPRLYVCQAPNAFICVSGVCPSQTPNAFICVSPNAFYMCVTKCVYMCVTKCVHMCVTSQQSSLRSLTFARFARTFFQQI